MTNFLQDNFISSIKKINSENEIDQISKDIAEKLSEIHKEKKECINWSEEYEIYANYSLYRHGLIKKAGLKDYILVDVLNVNKFLIKDRKVSRLIANSSLLKIDINNASNIKKSQKFGDSLLDLLDLNIIAYYNPKLAKKILEYSNCDISSHKFFRLFSFYTAKYTIDLIIEKSEIKYKDLRDEYDLIINFIFDSFDDFSTYQPKWSI